MITGGEPGVRRTTSRAGRRLKVRGNDSIAALLLQLGIEVRKPRRNIGAPCDKSDCPRRLARPGHVPIWHRDMHDIRDILKRARAVYRERVKHLHPDHGGEAQQMAALNGIWERIQKIFARHGCTLED